MNFDTRLFLLLTIQVELDFASIEIIDNGVFTEIQKLEIKEDNIFEEVVFKSDEKFKTDKTHFMNDSVHSDHHVKDLHVPHKSSLFDPFNHVKHLASEISEASIGTMAICFLFIALCCLSCTTEFS